MNYLEFIRHYQYTHIPSALSQIYYLNNIFVNKLVKPYRDNIVLGKPFGHSAYYYIWDKLGYISPQKYADGVRHLEIDFVDFADVTIGNALGVASGIEMGNGKMTYVNISDSQLQMGATLEAIQFIGRMGQNIKLTIDYNGEQLTSGLLTDIEADTEFFRSNGWLVIQTDNECIGMDYGFSLNGPVVVFVHTEKGEGIREIQSDFEKWHYRPIGDEEMTMTKELSEL